MDVETLAGECAALRVLCGLLIGHATVDNPAVAESVRTAIAEVRGDSRAFILTHFRSRSRKASQSFEALLDEMLANIRVAVD